MKLSKVLSKYDLRAGTYKVRLEFKKYLTFAQSAYTNSASLGGVAEWTMATVLKTVVP